MYSRCIPVSEPVAEACQDVLHGRNRRTGTPEHPLAGGLITCQFCGQSLTGERIRRKLKGGGVIVRRNCDSWLAL